MIRTIYKYMPCRQEFFENFLLRATPNYALNDPFEAQPTEVNLRKHLAKSTNTDFKSIEQILEELKNPIKDINSIELKDEYFNDYGIVSFTETRTNLLMWSHYASQHSGMVVGFKATHGIFSHGPHPWAQYSNLNKVNYDNIRYYDTDNYFDWLLRKSDDWMYEKEHRMIHKLTSCDSAMSIEGRWYHRVAPYTDPANEDFYSIVKERQSLAFVKFPKDSVESVTFGLKATKQDIQVIHDIIKKDSELSHVKVYCASLDSHRFELNITDGII